MFFLSEILEDNHNSQQYIPNLKNLPPTDHILLLILDLNNIHYPQVNTTHQLKEQLYYNPLNLQFISTNLQSYQKRNVMEHFYKQMFQVYLSSILYKSILGFLQNNQRTGLMDIINNWYLIHTILKNNLVIFLNVLSIYLYSLAYLFNMWHYL